MKALSLSATLLAAAVAVTTLPAFAADLDYRVVPGPDRYGSAYDDPRYRDLYGPEPRVYTYRPQPYEPRYEVPRVAPVPPGYVYRDRYAERYAEGCLPRREIRRRLHEDGWTEFHDVELRGETARMQARRRNGDLFALKVDRCSGDVLKAELLERVGPVPYADRGGPYRYERRYY
jgi:hypothetical protein